MNEKQFSDKVLAQAFRLLYGENWCKNWPVKAMANDMRSVIRGGNCPCAYFKNWVQCVKFLEQQPDVNKIIAKKSKMVKNFISLNGLTAFTTDFQPGDMSNTTLYLNKRGILLGLEFPHLYKPADTDDYAIQIWRAKKDFTPSKKTYSSVVITKEKTTVEIIQEVGVILSKIKP